MLLTFCLLVTFALWAGAGWSLCTLTHRRRGLEVDPWEQVRRPDPTGSEL